MKVYTRKGDDGSTGLLYGGRTPKDAPGPTAYGVTWYLTPELLLALAAGIAGSAPVWPAVAARWARPSADGPRLGLLASSLTCAALAAIFAGCAMLIAAHTYNPFIYFRF